MSHLVIIDGHAIAHRAYHSIPPLTVNGEPVNAIYGFYSMILNVIHTLDPKYLIVCLDSPGPVFRNEEFIAYRSKRKPTDSALVSQLRLLPETLQKSGIKNFAMGGFEADDLIATVSKKALLKKTNKNKLVSRVTIVTGDKDLMQLVTDKVNLYVPIKGLSISKKYDPDAVIEKLGVTPVQVIDLKALMGDSSDNYPGVDGIGPVAACNLLSTYHHLDNIYSHLDEIKPAIKEKLVKDRDNAYLSQKLATLVDNVPLRFTLRSSRLTPKTFQKLNTLFEEYNFKSLSSRLKPHLPLVVSKKEPSHQASLF